MPGSHAREALFVAMIIFTVAALYAVTGILGLTLAAGSPYSTAIWIPSGIALGATLVFGLRALPGVFIGSLIVNIYVTSVDVASLMEFKTYLIGSIIATDAVIQAWFGWYIIRRWVGLNNTLNEPNDILLFAFLSGPVSCLVNASFSNIALLILGILPISNFAQAWVTWYMGDSMGVLIFTPIFLILFAEPHYLWRARILPILLPLATTFLLILAGYLVARHYLANNDLLWFVLLCGFMFCVLVNIVLFIIHGQKNLMQLEMTEILRSAGESICGVNLNERIIFVNAAAEKMWHMSESDLLGKSIHDFINNVENDVILHDEDCPIYNAIHNNKTSFIANKQISLKDGTNFWAEYVCSPLLVANKTKGAVIVASDISKRRETEFNLERLAHYDTLTGLPNRISFLNELQRYLERPQEGRESLSICMVDLDHFKNINDNMGHVAGDLALKIISSLIADSIDTTDYFARLGGDEFGIILYDKSREEVNHFLEKLITTLNYPIEVHDTAFNISISVGVCSYPECGNTADDLIKHADIAMYQAKDAGRNTYAHYDAELSRSISRKRELEAELRNAIGRNELSLAYQPQLEIKSEKVIGLEVLLRWTSPVLGAVPPSEFIPVAERSGQIHQIGEWVLRQLAVEYKEIQRTVGTNLSISINISVMQLNDTRFFNNLLSILEKVDLRKILILEITETALMTNPRYTIDLMKHISKLGVNFSLDDFGMHYSCLRYLKSLPITQLKIDYYFVKDIAFDKSDLAIVNTIIRLSEGMGLPAIAEGVETKAQLDLLIKMGCKYVQGFYYFKPMPLTMLLAAIKNKV